MLHDYLKKEAVQVASQLLVPLQNVSAEFEEQKRNQEKLKKVQEQLLVFEQQQRAWLKLVKKLNTAVKELGDLENYCDYIYESIL